MVIKWHTRIIIFKPLWKTLLFVVVLQSLSGVHSLQPHRLQHARLPYPSPSSRACSNSCPLSWWFHQTISSSVIPFSSCLQPFPASLSFPVSRLFTSGGQSIGASASVLPVTISASNEYSGLISFQIDWFDLLVVQGTFKSPLVIWKKLWWKVLKKYPVYLALNWGTPLDFPASLN